MKDDSQSFARAQCLALAASVSVGRLVYTDKALPAVTLAGFILEGDVVTLYTGSDVALAAAIRNAVVAFQVDDFDTDISAGWSVTIIGQARLVDDAGDAAHLARLPLNRWVAGENGQYVRLPAREVSGGRIGRARLDTRRSA